MKEKIAAILLCIPILIIIGVYLAVSYVVKYELPSEDIDVSNLFMMGLAIFFVSFSGILYLFFKQNGLRKVAAVMCFFTFASLGNLHDEIFGENVGIVNWFEISSAIFGLVYALLEYWQFRPKNLLIRLREKWTQHGR